MSSTSVTCVQITINNITVVSKFDTVNLIRREELPSSMDIALLFPGLYNVCMFVEKGV